MSKCNITNQKLEPFMSFGKMPLANGFIEKKKIKTEKFYELKIGFNEEISLFQVLDLPKFSNTIYKNYPFFTHKSKFMINHFNKCAKWLKKNFLESRSNLFEIGSNDGTMLKNFKNTSINALGIDPSKNVAKFANEKGIKTLDIFFNKKNVNKLKKYHKKTKVIFAANVFCHIQDLLDVIYCVDQLLTHDGFFIFEEPYLGSMYKNVSYDQLYDEHIYMFSINSIMKIFNLYDFQLLDVIPQNTHGGSIRYIISRKSKYKIKKSVYSFLKYEDINNISNIEGCTSFKENCLKSKEKTIKNLNKLKTQNKKICGYGATAKSTTVLNYCKIGPEIIDCIYDTSIEKINKYSPGMHIPIISMNKFKNNKYDFTYLFAWNHKKEIFQKEKEYIKRGGKWLSHVKI